MDGLALLLRNEGEGRSEFMSEKDGFMAELWFISVRLVMVER